MYSCSVCGWRIFSEFEIKCPRCANPASSVNHWVALHEYAFSNAAWDEPSAIEFCKAWVSDIPKHTPYKCGCSTKWASFNFSFDTSSREKFQHSTVNGHNLVRKELKQPRFTHSQARELWTGPKVAFLSSSYLAVGGTEIFHRMLIPRLRERVNIIGFASTAFFGGDGSLLKVPFATGVDRAKELAAKADVVVTWGIDSLAGLIPQENKPQVISVHHSDASSLWSNRLQLLPQVDQIVCVNPQAADFIRTKTNKPVSHIANCVDPLRIAPSVEANSLRLKYGIPQDAKVVLFGHRLSEEKQPMKAIEIAQTLPDDYVMVVVGDGELMARCRGRDGGKVRVVGPVISLADWFNASDCFISLSTYDGYGLSVAEALAFGIPTVSTPRGIAVGRAIPCEATAPVAEWGRAIIDAINSPRPEKHTDLCDVDRFIDQWASICRGST